MDEYNKQLVIAADKLQEFADAIEPVFKAGHDKFQPNTDWWCVIAGMRHVALANVRDLRDMAKEPLRELAENQSKERWAEQIYYQRKRAVFESEIQGPCDSGCMMTWRNQYAHEASKK